MSAQRSEFRAGWKVLTAGMLGVMCGASPLPFNTIGFVLGPLHAEFGWSFATISAGVTTFGITAGLLAPVIGALADRFGVRRIALASLLAFALVFAGIGLIPGSLVAWFGMWFLVGGVFRLRHIIAPVEMLAQHLGNGIRQRAHAIHPKAQRASAADAGQLIDDQLEPFLRIEG